MQPNQKSRTWLSPLVIRSLGVLAISLMATTSPLAGSAEVPTCERVCDRVAETDCRPDCSDRNGVLCIPWNTNGWCFENCHYEWECVDGGRDCRGRRGEGQRLECTLQGEMAPW